jgi:hypothetical protein
MLIQVKIMPPVFYFGVCHMILPGILVWYMMRMQQEDERLALEQRKSREVEAGSTVALAVEDPSPTFLKELITINPVALIWVGACASIPLVVSSLLTPLETQRGRMAQGYVQLIYAPLMLAQIGFGYVLWTTRFIDLPKLYLAGFALLLSVPCFLVWCVCLLSASRYGRQDMTLVQRQRLERGREAKRAAERAVAPGAQEMDEQAAAGFPRTQTIVDITEAQHQQWQLINTA